MHSASQVDKPVHDAKLSKAHSVESPGAELFPADKLEVGVESPYQTPHASSPLQSGLTASSPELSMYTAVSKDQSCSSSPTASSPAVISSQGLVVDLQSRFDNAARAADSRQASGLVNGEEHGSASTTIAVSRSVSALQAECEQLGVQQQQQEQDAGGMGEGSAGGAYQQQCLVQQGMAEQQGMLQQTATDGDPHAGDDRQQQQLAEGSATIPSKVNGIPSDVLRL